MIKYFHYTILFFLFFSTHQYLRTSGISDEVIKIEKLSFSIANNIKVNLDTCCQELVNHEESLTNYIAESSDEFTKNICIGSFILIDEEGNSLTPINLLNNENEQMVFVSGKLTYDVLITAKQRIKNREENFRRAFSKREAFWEKYDFEHATLKKNEKDSRKQEVFLLNLYEHFSYLWKIDEIPLSKSEKSFYQSGKFEIVSLLNNPSDKLKKIATLSESEPKDDGSSPVQPNQTTRDLPCSDYFSDDEDFTSDNSDTVYLGPVLVEDGSLHSLLLNLNNASKIQNYSPGGMEIFRTQLSEIKKSLSSIQNEITAIENDIDGIYKRWCSEQKLIDFLKKDNTWQINVVNTIRDKNIKGCFFLLHSYQNPCVCCRLSLVRAFKVFLKHKLQNLLGEGVPFHIVASYRQEYSSPLFKDFEEVKENKEDCISISKDSPYLFLCNISKRSGIDIVAGLFNICTLFSS